MLACGDLAEDEIRIVLCEDHEEVWDVRTRKHGMPLSFRDVDLRTGAGNLSRKQPLGRAVGVSASTVVDATAGLGHDACLLACMGWQVTAIERDPFIACMLRASVEDARRHAELWDRMGDWLEVRVGDAESILESCSPDVVYLDPMYTARRKKSALPRKPAQLLQALATASDDEALLQAALRSAPRVVVKRPNDGEPIGGTPTTAFAGRQVRYDVYLTATKAT